MDKILLEIHKKRHPRNIAEHWLDSQKARKEKRKAKNLLSTPIKTCGMVEKMKRDGEWRRKINIYFISYYDGTYKKFLSDR
jgi:hypothetical protein